MDENINNGEIVVAARTYVYLADVGTVAPVDAIVPMPTGWLGVGLTTTDSMNFATEPNFQQVMSAQSDKPSLIFQTDEAATLAVELQQWNAANMKAVYGGGEVTAVTPATTPPTFKFVPPKVGERKEKACIVEVIFGARHYRFVYPRVFQMEGVALALQKGQESRLPLKFGLMGGDLADDWYLLTDDPAFDPAAVAP